MTIPTQISFVVAPLELQQQQQQPEEDDNESAITFASEEDSTLGWKKLGACGSSNLRFPRTRMSLHRRSLSPKKRESQSALPSLPKRRETVILEDMVFDEEEDDDDASNPFVAPAPPQSQPEQEPLERQTMDDLPSVPKRRKTIVRNEPLPIQDWLDKSDIGSLADESVVEDDDEEDEIALEASYEQIRRVSDAERRESDIPTPPMRRESVVEPVLKDTLEILDECNFMEDSQGGSSMFLSPKPFLQKVDDTCEVLPPRQPRRKRSILQAYAASPKRDASAMKTRSVQELQKASSMPPHRRVRGMRRVATAQPGSFANTKWRSMERIL